MKPSAEPAQPPARLPTAPQPDLPPSSVPPSELLPLSAFPALTGGRRGGGRARAPREPRESQVERVLEGLQLPIAGMFLPNKLRVVGAGCFSASRTMGSGYSLKKSL